MRRNYSFDLMRIFLCIFVITYHSLTYFGQMSVMTNDILSVFLLQANGLFYMVSGYYNLEKEFNTKEDIIQFYKKRIITIIIPFLIYVLIWTAWDYIHDNSVFNFFDFLAAFYRSVMESTASSHLWFMYPLFGFILVTPFLSKMLHSLNDKQLKMLWRIAIGYNVVYYFLCGDFGISFRVNWIFDGWIIYYLAGYYYRAVASKENKFKWLILGALGYIGTIIGMNGDLPFIETFSATTDIQPMFTIYCVGCFAFWDKVIHISKEKIGNAISFLAANTFMIYMYHMRSLSFIEKRLQFIEPGFLRGTLIVIGTFLISLIVSIILSYCTKPIQKLIDKKWTIKEQ